MSWKKCSALGEYGCLGKIKLEEALPLLCLLSYLLFLSLLMWSCPQLCLPAYSFWSPLQPPWFLHYFLRLLPMGPTRLVGSYIPIPAQVFPHPQWLENPCLRPLQHLLAFLVILLLSIFFFTSLASSLSHLYISVFWLWAGIHLANGTSGHCSSEQTFSTAIWNAAMKWGYLAIVHFFP